LPVLDERNGESMSEIIVKAKGLDTAMKNLDKLDSDLLPYLQGSRLEIADEVLKVQGLRSYPPATAANLPPPPYYIRGRGMQVSANRNTGSSQKLGTRWTSLPYQKTGVVISNPVSYAQYVHGEQQAQAMAKIGWRKLSDIATEKIGAITVIYEKWIDKLLIKYNLK
jgi:hypothetical protein